MQDVVLQMIGLNLTFLTEVDLSLSIDLILTMLCLNMEFAKDRYWDQSFS